MKVVIPGGSGLIGQALCRKLAGDKHQVAILSRNPDKVRGLPAGIEVVKWDGRTSNGWGQLVEGADAIINLAGTNLGEGRWTEERKREILESRLNAGQAVVEAVSKAASKPRALIQASAVGYYGERDNEELTEQTGPGDDFPAHVCIQWEASTEPVDAMGVRRTIIRTGVVLSRRAGALPRMALPFKLFAGGPIGGGKQPFPWIHIEDEARAILWLVEHGGAGPYNLAAPHVLTNAEFSKVLGRAMGRPSIMPVPAFALKALYGEMSMIVLEGQRATPHRLLSEGFDFRYPEAEAALRDLFK
jgi:uncharacterized protein (TIGR01777 family)